MREAFKNGGQGVAYDGKLLGNWDFDMQDIDVGVKLWYGDQDTNCPVDMGRKLVQRLKHGELKIFPGEGHVTLAANNGEEILRELSANR